MRSVFGSPLKTHENHVLGTGKIDQDEIILLDPIPVFPPRTFGKVLMIEVAAIPILLRILAVTFHCLPESHSKFPFFLMGVDPVTHHRTRESISRESSSPRIC